MLLRVTLSLVNPTVGSYVFLIEHRARGTIFNTVDAFGKYLEPIVSFYRTIQSGDRKYLQTRIDKSCPVNGNIRINFDEVRLGVIGGSSSTWCVLDFRINKY